MSDEASTEAGGEKPTGRRRTYLSPDETDGESAAESSEQPNAAIPLSEAAPLDENRPDPAAEEPRSASEAPESTRASEDTGPAHRADAPVDSAADSAKPIIIEHPVADDPVEREGERDTAQDSSSAPLTAPAAAEPPVSEPEGQEAPPVAEPVVAAAAPAVALPVAPTSSAQTEPATAPVASAPPQQTEQPRTVYLDAPKPPAKKNNRVFGLLVAILATLVFTILWLGVAAVVISFGTTPDRFVDSLTNFATSAAFWTPVAVYLFGLAVLVLLLNRARWAWFILGGFVVGVLVFAGYLAGGLITVSQQITMEQVPSFLRSIALTPLAIGAGLVAREVTIWAGAIIAARGRRVVARNEAAQEAYERDTLQQKAEYERSRAGSADA